MVGAAAASPPEELVREEWPRLVAAIRAMTGSDHEEAEDAAHDAVLAALERGQQFATVEDAFRWTREVAKNKIIRLRHGRRRTGGSPEMWEAVRDVAEVVLLQEECRATREDLLALPSAQREVLALRVLDALPPRVIAEQLGMNVTLVKTRLAEARRSLRNRRRDRGYCLAPGALAAAWEAVRRTSAPVAVTAVGVATWIAVTVLPTTSPHVDAPATWAEEATSLRLGEPLDRGAAVHDHAARSANSGNPRQPPSSHTGRLPQEQRAKDLLTASGSACVSAAGCLGTDTTLPPSAQDTVYIRVPPAAGEGERYFYVQAPKPITSNVAPWACDAVPDTALTGCNPGSSGSTESPRLPGKKV